ncbi:Cell division protein FtsB [Tenacibaculum soleae]
MCIDLVILYRFKNGFSSKRIVSDKLSNSDENEIAITLENKYPFQVFISLIDELPTQFQKRDFDYKTSLQSAEKSTFTYSVRPVERGVYNFGSIHVFVSSILQIFSRRYTFSDNKSVKVYPSYIQMKKYEFLAMHNSLTEFGMKKIRRIGHTMEFEQIKNYIPGDDVRNVNWKATAKRGALMVNQYQDEKSQPIYSIIDLGRVMKMPFEGLSLLDYAINSALAFSNIALLKNDKAGMLTFSKNVEKIIAASNKKTNLSVINEELYNITTNFTDANFALLYATIKRKINQRSLLILYTNFEHISALKRQLPYLKAIAKKHLLVTVFFENTELDSLINKNSKDLQGVYHKTIAEKYAFEKRLIVKELERNSIHAILTKPQQLSVNVINKYLEFKAKGMI